jgi:hypothetical protein
MEDGGWRMEDGGWRMEADRYVIPASLPPRRRGAGIQKTTMMDGCHRERTVIPNRVRDPSARCAHLLPNEFGIRRAPARVG